jgi:hypothetical protein
MTMSDASLPLNDAEKALLAARWLKPSPEQRELQTLRYAMTIRDPAGFDAGLYDTDEQLRRCAATLREQPRLTHVPMTADPSDSPSLPAPATPNLALSPPAPSLLASAEGAS